MTTLSIEESTIVQGNCIDVLKSIPDGSVDLVVTSPPYNAGKDYSEYEDRQSLDEYTEFARQWTAEIPRILSPTGSFWLNVGYTKTGPNSTLPLTYLYWQVLQDRLPLVQELVWHYNGGMAYKRRFTHRSERWQWFAKDPDNVYFDLDSVRDKSLNISDTPKNNPLGKNPTDVWLFNHVTSSHREKTSHPCQFPEAMIRRIILACSPVDGMVVDPFSGSGTTAKVALENGRRCLGIEMDSNYITESRQRLTTMLREKENDDAGLEMWSNFAQ